MHHNLTVVVGRGERRDLVHKGWVQTLLICWDIHAEILLYTQQLGLQMLAGFLASNACL
jgi:hypothetical protein